VFASIITGESETGQHNLPPLAELDPFHDERQFHFDLQPGEITNFSQPESWSSRKSKRFLVCRKRGSYSPAPEEDIVIYLLASSHAVAPCARNQQAWLRRIFDGVTLRRCAHKPAARKRKAFDVARPG